MAKLNIHINLSHLDASQLPVPTEILDSELDVQHKLVVHGTHQAEIAAGTYLVRAILPSGEALSSQVTIAPDQASAEVTLWSKPSPHEYLAWQQVLGGYRGRAQTHESAPGKISIDVPHTPPGGDVWGAHVGQDESVWIRMWRMQSWRGRGGESGFAYENSSAWQVEPMDAWQPKVYSEHDMPEVRVMWLYPPDSTPRIRCLQVGGAGIPWRSICLPPSPDPLQVLMRPSASGSKLNGGLAVKAVTADHETEALSHYALSGDFNTAEGLAEDVMRKAEHLFQEKLIYPYGAMIGAYHLLFSGKLDRLGSWANNFANWVDWLPDSAVIHAWWILYSGDEAQRGTARQRLLQAAYSGLPVMRKGLRLLVDGLSMFADLARQEEAADEEVERALSYVRRYAKSTDWNQRLTTFYGETPASPGLKPVLGDAPEAVSRPESLVAVKVRF